MQTYEDILHRMELTYKMLAGTPVEDATDLGIRMKVLAGEIYSLQVLLEHVRRQAFVQTAVGEGLDRHAGQHGLARRKAQAAVGTLVFSRREVLPYDVDIPQGVVCTTAGEAPEEFVTTAPCVLKRGALEVSAPAKAVRSGQSTNAAAGTVTVLSTIPIGVEGVSNPAPFSGGKDGETDESLRARLLACCGFAPSGSNLEFYRRAALACEGVGSAAAICTPDRTGEVTVYVRGMQGPLSETQMQAVQDTLSEQREINVNVTVTPATELARPVSVYIQPVAGCTQKAAEEAVKNAIRNYFSTLKIGEPFLLIHVGQYILNTGYVANYDFAVSTKDGPALTGCVYVAGDLWAGEL